MKIYTNDLVKGHSDFKVKCLTFGLYTQVSDSGPLGPLVLDAVRNKNQENCKIGNRKQSAVLYSAVVRPWSSILFYLILVIRIECNWK